MSNRNTRWLDNIHDQLKILMDDAFYLEGLTKSFRNVGNTKISGELGAIANDMLTAQKEIGGNIGKMLSDQVDKGNKEIGNILKAVIKTS